MTLFLKSNALLSHCTTDTLEGTIELSIPCAAGFRDHLWNKCVNWEYLNHFFNFESLFHYFKRCQVREVQVRANFTAEKDYNQMLKCIKVASFIILWANNSNYHNLCLEFYISVREKAALYLHLKKIYTVCKTKEVVKRGNSQVPSFQSHTQFKC